jgi:hypothetical protein
MNFKAVVLICSVISLLFAQNSSIVLRNGQSARAAITDTNGCNITIIRNGNKVAVSKSQVRLIVLGSDTFDYSAYVCQEKAKKAISANETSESKILDFLASANKVSSPLEPASMIGYFAGPLLGSMDRETDSLLNLNVKGMLSRRFSLSPISADTIWAMLSGKPGSCRYAFIIKQFRDEIDTKTNRILYTNKKEEIISIAEAVIIDLRKKDIVFSSLGIEKRSVFGVSNRSAASLVLSDEMKDKIVANRAERMANRNYSNNIETLLDDLAGYLYPEN